MAKHEPDHYQLIASGFILTRVTDCFFAWSQIASQQPGQNDDLELGQSIIDSPSSMGNIRHRDSHDRGPMVPLEWNGSAGD